MNTATPSRNNRRRRGSVCVLAALSFTVILAALGMAVDGGNLYLHRRLMQNAADAAAFAGAIELSSGASNTTDNTVLSAVQNYAGYNYVTDTSDNVTAQFTDINGAVIETIPHDGNAPPSNAVGVQVVTKCSANSIFLGIIGMNSYNASAMAAAWGIAGSSSGGNGGYAIFAIEANKSNGTKVLDWSGSSWNVTGNVHTNSDLNMSASSNKINGTIQDVTGTQMSGSSNVFTPATNNPVQSTVQSDPINLPASTFYQGTTSTSTYHYVEENGNGTTNLSSYITNGVLQAGVYYVNGNVNLGTSLSSTVPSNVTIVATGYEDISASSFDFTPYSHGIDFAAYGSGNSAPGNIALNVSGSSGTWNGIIYAPNSGLEMSGSSNTTLNGSLVGYSIKLSGSSLGLTYNSSYWPAQPSGQAQIVLYK